MKTPNLVEAVFKLIYAFKSQLSQELAAEDISVPIMYMKMLKMISAIEGCTAQVLAQSLKRDKAQITRVVQDMIAKSLIVRVPNPDDKRSQLLSVSPEGVLLLQKMLQVEQRILTRMSANVSEEEIAQFIVLAKTLSDNIYDA
ncbi:MarR family winged helix-turn-helix transcriptional regulator [Shewanella sp.]|uniref:MarR family winged helix-turn-helix transcriptional regulator n=1 Tax=Shewanella sp. TaxID=50422 RepID=UPI0040539AB5